jgi:1-acyl-sn-glycerol-3-phosphate acyltransferase
LEPATQYHVQKINQPEKINFRSGTSRGTLETQMKTAMYCAGKLLVRLLFGCVARVHVIGRENVRCVNGFLLASNHISHFDPFFISLPIRRKIDWMTMAEFFRPRALSFVLRSIDAFPAERDRADLKTIRTAIDRLKSGRVVGLFPEGGIRDGARSLLEGAPLRPGAATLAHIADVPIVPCIILGTDRLYSKKQWLPFRRTPVWIAFGKPVSCFRELKKYQARHRVEAELAAAFKNLYAELRGKFRLTADDLPHSPHERRQTRSHPERPVLRSLGEGGSRATRLEHSKAKPRNSSTAPRSVRSDTLRRASAKTIDSLLCASINWLHRRHQLNGDSRQEMERYLSACEPLSPQEYYVPPHTNGSNDCSDSKPVVKGMLDGRMATVSWRSPIKTAFAANNTARVDFFRTDAQSWTQAPTVLLLHALMSSSATGHYRWAERFNELGWNACFVHLPYHFSRVPTGYWNGELAITPDLIRNAEGLRQGVIELRQIMESLRGQGCREFGVLATSYGGWIGALLTLVESDFRFVALMSPIVNIEHAIWHSPAACRIRRELLQANIERTLVARHFHLSSPLHGRPLCDPARILFVTGKFDSIAPSAEIEAIHQTWRGSELLHVRQGHFGHRMMPETIAHLKQRGDI